MAMPQCCYLAKGAKRPSHTTNMQTFSKKLSSNILVVTALKASNLNSAVWDQIFIFCCMNRRLRFYYKFILHYYRSAIHQPTTKFDCSAYMSGSFLLIPPVKRSNEIIIELKVTTYQIAVFYNSNCN